MRSALLNSPRTAAPERAASAMFRTSLLTAIAVICAAAVGFVLDNAVMMVAGMVLGGIVVNLTANVISRRPRARARGR
jgi:NAD/NADP transhydrogenase beta subunit